MQKGLCNVLQTILVIYLQIEEPSKCLSGEGDVFEIIVCSSLLNVQILFIYSNLVQWFHFIHLLSKCKSMSILLDGNFRLDSCQSVWKLSKLQSCEDFYFLYDCLAWRWWVTSLFIVTAWLIQRLAENMKIQCSLLTLKRLDLKCRTWFSCQMKNLDRKWKKRRYGNLPDQPKLAVGCNII